MPLLLFAYCPDLAVDALLAAPPTTAATLFWNIVQALFEGCEYLASRSIIPIDIQLDSIRLGGPDNTPKLCDCVYSRQGTAAELLARIVAIVKQLAARVQLQPRVKNQVDQLLQKLVGVTSLSSAVLALHGMPSFESRLAVEWDVLTYVKPLVQGQFGTVNVRACPFPCLY